MNKQDVFLYKKRKTLSHRILFRQVKMRSRCLPFCLRPCRNRVPHIFILPFISILSFYLITLFTSSAFSQTLHVPNHFLSIQEAVDAAAPGDTIIVASGTFELHRGNITIGQNNIYLKSAYGPLKTVIKGQGGTPIISVNEKITCVIDGFTIKPMDGTEGDALQGGGIYCGQASSPTIVNNLITNNRAVFGGGIYCDIYSSVTISQNVISYNNATRFGGAVFAYDAPVDILNNEIAGNQALYMGGAIFCRKEAPKIKNNVIWQNKAKVGGGIACDRSACVIVNNTIVSNTATFGGGIFFEGGAIRIINTILWENTDDIYSAKISSASRPEYSNIQDGDFRGINGNISKDPLFLAPKQGNFYLQTDSPCLNGGNDNLIYDDVDGTRNDMGAYGGPGGDAGPSFGSNGQ